MLIVTVNKVFDHTPTDSWRLSIKLPSSCLGVVVQFEFVASRCLCRLKDTATSSRPASCDDSWPRGTNSRLTSNKASGLADLSRDALWETSLSSYRCHIQKKKTDQGASSGQVLNDWGWELYQLKLQSQQLNEEGKLYLSNYLNT